MTQQELGVTLQKSLDEVDRGIKRFVWVWLIMSITVVAGLIWLGHLSTTADVRTMVLWAVVILLVAQGVNLVLSCAVMSAMTRKTLKAIELISRH
ncbi:MAG TPA: hypothetical protein VMU05_17355 [Dongiaceae bacterium]|nr:hypothetical protein [Dongiaceae bacterium]